MRNSFAAACSLPLRSTVVWQKQHTDISIWPARNRAKLLLVFISGNPGLIEYYDDFLSHIHSRSPKMWEVIGLGHLAHSPSQPASMQQALAWQSEHKLRKLPSLQDQIESKISLLDDIKARYSEDTRVILVGHSVGAYICQKIMKARPGLVHKMYGLFPSLAQIAQTPNGRKLAPLFRNECRLAIVGFLWVFQLLIPFTVARWLVQITTRQQQPASNVTTKLILSPAVVSAAIAMGADEMEIIRELDEDFLASHGDKVTLYFAAGDTDDWIGPASRVRKITAALDSSKTVSDTSVRWHICGQGMQHAFCLEHSEAMASLCADWIAADVAVDISDRKQ